jgi:putative peptidoglycan lipid II flippase
MLTIGSLSVGVKLVATAKELVVARYFGTADVLDAFLVAFALPNFAIGVLTGSLNAAFIPTFIRVREERGMHASQRLMSNVLGVSLLLLTTMSLLLAAGAGLILPLVAPGFSTDKMALTRQLYWMLLPLLVINGTSQIWGGVINAGERFALTAIAPLFAPLAPIVLLLAGGTRFGIYALAIGTALGSLSEAALVWIGLRRLGYSPLPRFASHDAETREVMRQYAPMVAASIFGSSTTLVDQSMATRLGNGSVAALAYGNRVVSMVLTLLALSLGSAMLPHLSKMIAAQDWAGIRHTLRTYARIILVAGVPVALALAALSRPLVRLLYQRGAFTAADTSLVGDVQACYILQLPAYLLGILAVRLLSAMRAVRFITAIAAVNVVVNLLGDWLLMRVMGLPGIALSTAILYTFSTAMLFLVLRRKLHGATAQVP